MATHITQIDDTGGRNTTLRVNGELFVADAHLIEKIARTVTAETGRSVTVDLADVDFLDSESASVLKRAESEGVFRIEGVEIFLQAVVNEAERS